MKELEPHPITHTKTHLSVLGVIVKFSLILSLK
uniref:Uncharacterized protein n=1 Tax=Arundo donax TaxID=35708 RepID=A0A0A9A161_ARUDO